MQQTKSYWRVVAALGVVGAFVSSACVVTTSTDDNTGGDTGETNTTAGSTSAGSSAGGASAGSSNTSGAGAQGSDYQCDTADGGAPPATAADCSAVPPQANDACAVCLRAQCCTELGDCYATTPGNQCGYGGPNDGGEYSCFQKCVHDAFATDGVDNDDLRMMCSNQCTTSTDHKSSHDCGLIGTQTNALIGCLSDNCLMECIGG